MFSRFSIAFVFLVTSLFGAFAFASSRTKEEDAKFTAAIEANASPAMVIGFVGGYVSHDNAVHAEVQLANKLRREYSPQLVHVEAFENHRGALAREVILKLLDANHDGLLSADEKKDARVIFYGHSWGAAEAIYVARQLGKEGIPVLLTIQVDSVTKNFRNDALVPPNVEQAVNFYQSKGFVKGEAKIRAADPARTRILGNFRIDYTEHPISCKSYPWWDRYIVKPHTEIECDPDVWQQVENLIRANLPPTSDNIAKNVSKLSK
jgi:hypothetical protein